MYNYINDILRICFTRIWLKDALACLRILDSFQPLSVERFSCSIDRVAKMKTD